MTKTVAVSGGFDPIHEGHIRYLKGAYEIAQRHDFKLMVILNTDEWLERKGNGHPFYNYEQRKEILEAIRYVDLVVPQIEKSIRGFDDIDSVAESLRVYQPRIFAKGGDRTKDTLPETELLVCNRMSITIITGVGGLDKPNSSSWVIKKIRET